MIYKLKKSLIDQYDLVKSKIDIDAQTALLEMTDQTKKDQLLAVNIQLINECEHLFNTNMNDINEAIKTAASSNDP